MENVTVKINLDEILEILKAGEDCKAIVYLDRDGDIDYSVVDVNVSMDGTLNEQTFSAYDLEELDNNEEHWKEWVTNCFESCSGEITSEIGDTTYNLDYKFQ